MNDVPATASKSVTSEDGRPREGAAIQIDRLTKKYGEIVAVDSLDLVIDEGELFGLLGPNGSGKTTAINCLTGLTRMTSGTIRVAGLDIRNDLNAVRSMLGVSPQETAVYPHLTGRENIELFGSLYSVPRERLKERTDALIQKLGLTQDADRRVAKYSGGMKRRVSIAMALVQDPAIVFLDEPTVTMDPQSRRAMWDVIRQLKSEGKTTLLTTHYMEEAEELCDRVGVLDHGKLIELGSPGDLKAKHEARTLEDVFLKLTGRMIREGT